MTERHPLDVSLHDSELHEELQLTTALIIAANELGEGKSLSPERIDQLLGVEHPAEGPGTTTELPSRVMTGCTSLPATDDIALHTGGSRSNPTK